LKDFEICLELEKDQIFLNETLFRKDLTDFDKLVLTFIESLANFDIYDSSKKQESKISFLHMNIEIDIF
jgi:hypothetical protein